MIAKQPSGCLMRSLSVWGRTTRLVSLSSTSSFSTTWARPADKRVAVLFQSLDPPLINGVRKPKKPGGYRDSGADIAYVLSRQCQLDVLTPVDSPNPRNDEDWCFGDDNESILEAVRRGATHLWANTILFSDHPLQTSSALTTRQNDLYVVGQPPRFVQLYDDKEFVNGLLRAQSGFCLPKAVVVSCLESLRTCTAELRLPVIAKPVRGRGSHGVKLCESFEELESHVAALVRESPKIIIEEYLSGEEATVTVMPPSQSRAEYWALPVVTRFNHIDGIAPYNGVVAVSRNSRVVGKREFDSNSTYRDAVSQCIAAAKLLQCKAPIRIDVRRYQNTATSPFALFDVNMKPNMTGPGRPGREDQASLTALAAAGQGWTYSDLLRCILDSACSLHDLRGVKLPVTLSGKA